MYKCTSVLQMYIVYIPPVYICMSCPVCVLDYIVQSRLHLIYFECEKHVKCHAK